MDEQEKLFGVTASTESIKTERKKFRIVALAASAGNSVTVRDEYSGDVYTTHAPRAIEIGEVVYEYERDVPVLEEGPYEDPPIKCGFGMDFSFGGILNHYRVKRELTLRKMSEDLGISVAEYSNIEQSRQEPPASIRSLKSLTRSLDLSGSEFELLAAAAFNFHLGRLRQQWEEE